MRLSAVAASGVVVVLYDPRLRCGGMSHYAEPYRRRGLSTAMFAAPAIVTLVRMMQAGGSARPDMEANIYGGAVNPKSPRFDAAIAGDNARVGLELLARMQVRIACQDLGGTHGRKVVFNTSTGELAVARVARVREDDWYPKMLNGEPEE